KHLAADVNGNWLLFDTASGEHTRSFEGLKFRSLVPLPSGSLGKRETSVLPEAALTPDGKKVWSKYPDGTLWLRDVATGKELCRLHSFGAGKEWLVTTPEGLFDGTEGGQRLVTLREAGTLKLIEDESARRRLYRPGLLATLGKGENP